MDDMHYEMTYYEVEETVCNECGKVSTFGSHAEEDESIFYCKNCWVDYLYDAQLQEDLAEIKKKKEKRTKSKQNEPKKRKKKGKGISITNNEIKEAASRGYYEIEDLVKRKFERLKWDKPLDFPWSQVRTDLEISANELNPLAYSSISPAVMKMFDKCMFNPTFLSSYSSYHISDWYIMLFKSGDANSDVGKDIIREFVSKLKTFPSVKLINLNLRTKLSPYVDPDNFSIQACAISCMIRVDCAHFMRCIKDNQWKPNLPAHFVDFLYDECKEFIDPDFEVPGHRIIKNWKTYLKATTKKGTCVRPFLEHVLDYITRKFQEESATISHEYTSHEDLQNAIDYCRNAGATFIGNTSILPAYLNSSVPHVHQNEISVMMAQGCILPKDFKFSSSIAEKVYNRSIRGSRKYFRDTARAIGRALKNYDDVDEIIVLTITDFLLVSFGQIKFEETDV